MNHTRTIIALGILWLIAAMSERANAQGKITLQHNEQFTYYSTDSLQPALDDAQDGDIVLLPGGTFAGSFTVGQRISLVGVGFHPDSTTATSSTVLSGDLRLLPSAGGSYFSGLHILQDIQVLTSGVRVDNIVIHRCHIAGDVGYFLNVNSSNWLISESVLGSQVWGMKSCRISNCIVEYSIQNHVNLIVEHSIFLYGTTTSARGVQSCANCVVQGNVFAHPLGRVSGVAGQWSHVANNVFVYSSPGAEVTNVQNVFNASQTSLFVSYDGTTTWIPTMNFHLASNSPAIGTGPGGTDCGIYGGPNPWKEGAVPITPHIQEQVIGTTTNSTGGLPVHVRVAAQDR